MVPSLCGSQERVAELKESWQRRIVFLEIIVSVQSALPLTQVPLAWGAWRVLQG